MAQPVLLYLSCGNDNEANRIATELLRKRLIVCAKQIPVKSSYWWRGKITHDAEVMLILESDQKFFDKIEAEVAVMHSYDTFVMQAVPVSAVSKKAIKWMQDELGDE